MQDLNKASSDEQGFLSFLRGTFIGLIGITAIGVWAINTEMVLTGRTTGGALEAVIRVILCDAIPLATLLAIFRGITRNKTAEEDVRGIIGSVFWFVPIWNPRRTAEAINDESSPTPPRR